MGGILAQCPTFGTFVTLGGDTMVFPINEIKRIDKAIDDNVILRLPDVGLTCTVVITYEDILEGPCACFESFVTEANDTFALNLNCIKKAGRDTITYIVIEEDERLKRINILSPTLDQLVNNLTNCELCECCFEPTAYNTTINECSGDTAKFDIRQLGIVINGQPDCAEWELIGLDSSIGYVVKNGCLASFIPGPVFNQTTTASFRFANECEDDTASLTINMPLVNGATSAEDDSFCILKNQVLWNSVLANDQLCQNPITRLIDDVENGNLLLLDNGSFAYIPVDTFTGYDTFTYSLTCGLSCSYESGDTAQVIIEVVDGGVIKDCAFSIPKGGGDLILSDLFGCDSLTADLIKTTADSSVLVIGDTLRYTPGPGETSIEVFLRISCKGKYVDIVKVTIEVAIARCQEDIVSDTVRTKGSVAKNDFWCTSGKSVWKLLGHPAAHGNLDPPIGPIYFWDTLTGDYIIDSVRKDTQICYELICVTDAGSDICDTCCLNLTGFPLSPCDTVTAIAVDDSLCIIQDVPGSGDVTLNDTVLCIDEYRVTTPTKNGTLIFNMTGIYIYEPNPGFVGRDTFCYTIDCLPCRGLDSACVYIEVLSGQIRDDSITIPKSGRCGLNVVANDSCGGQDSSVWVNTTGLRGILTGTPDNFCYYPADGESGGTATYRVYCNGKLIGIGTLTIRVVEGSCANESYEVQDTVTEIKGNVSTNDSPCTQGAGTRYKLVGYPFAHGNVNILPGSNPRVTFWDTLTGDFTLTFDKSLEGDTSICYELICALADTNVVCDTCCIDLTIPPGFPDPCPDTIAILVDDYWCQIAGTEFNEEVALNDSLFCSPIRFIETQGPKRGKLIFGNNGTFQYIPDTPYVGLDTFCYTATCDTLVVPTCPANDTACVVLQYKPDTTSTGDTCLASGNLNDDTYCFALIDVPLLGNVSDNDTLTNCNPDTFRVSKFPNSGILSMNVNGSFTFTTDQVGKDTFCYDVICDTCYAGSACVYIETYDITVKNETFRQPKLERCGYNATANDSCRGGNIERYAWVDLTGAAGQVTGDPNNFCYEPGNDESVAILVYSLTCGISGCDSVTLNGTVTIEIVQAECLDEFYYFNGDTTFTDNVGDNDTECTYNEGTRFILQDYPNANGNVDINPGEDVRITRWDTADGTFTIDISNGWLGDTQICYLLVCDFSPDTLLPCDTCCINITVEPCQDSITTRNDTFCIEKGMTLNGDVRINDSTCLTPSYSQLGPTPNGSLTFLTDGSFVYTPNAGFSGKDSFEYRAGCPCNFDTSLVCIRVEEVLALDTSFIIGKGGISNVSGVREPPCAAGSTPTYVWTAQGAPGVLTGDPDNFSFTPDPIQTGTVVLAYDITCGCVTRSRTITLEITNSFCADDMYIRSTGFSATVSDNDTPCDQGGLTKYTLVDYPNAHGTVDINPGEPIRITQWDTTDGTFTVVYDGFEGDTSICYVIQCKGSVGGFQPCDTCCFKIEKPPCVNPPCPGLNTFDTLCLSDDAIFNLHTKLDPDTCGPIDTRGIWEVVSGPADPWGIDMDGLAHNDFFNPMLAYSTTYVGRLITTDTACARSDTATLTLRYHDVFPVVDSNACEVEIEMYNPDGPTVGEFKKVPPSACLSQATVQWNVRTVEDCLDAPPVTLQDQDRSCLIPAPAYGRREFVFLGNSSVNDVCVRSVVVYDRQGGAPLTLAVNYCIGPSYGGNNAAGLEAAIESALITGGLLAGDFRVQASGNIQVRMLSIAKENCQGHGFRDGSVILNYDINNGSNQTVSGLGPPSINYYSPFDIDPSWYAPTCSSNTERDTVGCELLYIFSMPETPQQCYDQATIAWNNIELTDSIALVNEDNPTNKSCCYFELFADGTCVLTPNGTTWTIVAGTATLSSGTGLNVIVTGGTGIVRVRAVMSCKDCVDEHEWELDFGDCSFN